MLQRTDNALRSLSRSRLSRQSSDKETGRTTRGRDKWSRIVTFWFTNFLIYNFLPGSDLGFIVFLARLYVWRLCLTPMTALDDLPIVNSFLGIDLKTGSLIVAAICIVHPMAYGCSFFMPMSYLIVTIWILVALFFAASIGLFFGVVHDDALLCHIWIWYSLVFVVVMLMMMIMLALVFTSRRQRNRVCVVILGLLWYILTIYFILVVNSHRKELETPPPPPPLTNASKEIEILIANQ